MTDHHGLIGINIVVPNVLNQAEGKLSMKVSLRYQTISSKCLAGIWGIIKDLSWAKGNNPLLIRIKLTISFFEMAFTMSARLTFTASFSPMEVFIGIVKVLTSFACK
jgi:hypothetical protein